MKTKKIKAYAVLGYPDKRPMPFGSLAKSFKGSLSVFAEKADADRMAATAPLSWLVRRCEILIHYKHND